MASDELRSPVHDEELEPEELEGVREPAGRGRPCLPRRSRSWSPWKRKSAEIAAAGSTATDAAESGNELEALSRAGAVKAWTIEELGTLVEEAKSAIVMEDGVFRIKEEVYTAGERPREAGQGSPLREIAAEVVRHEGKAGEGPQQDSAPHVEEPGTSGIGDLLRDEDTLDLSKVVSGEKAAAPEEELTIDREKIKPAAAEAERPRLRRVPLLVSRARSPTRSQMKSLVEVSRRVSAVSAGLFLKKVQGFVPDLTVGLSEKSVKTFVFARDGAVCRQLPADAEGRRDRQEPGRDEVPEHPLRPGRYPVHEDGYSSFLPFSEARKHIFFFRFPAKLISQLSVMLSKLIVQ